MKRPLHTYFAILFISIFVNLPQLSAAIWQTNPDNGGGEWSDENTWLNMITGLPGVPQAGDLIIINGADFVTISSTVDLSTIHDNTPTFIVVNGILKFWSPPNCGNNACDIDLILDSGSEINVQSAAPLKGIQEEGPGIGLKDIYIGGVSVLPTDEWPFGPGILPMEFALPVELVSFNGIALENSILLKWQTGSEENTKEFVLERSATGRDNFVEIGTVNASGFSTSLQNYSLEDKAPIMLGYYRLKIIDFDGTFEYSHIIAVQKLRTSITQLEIFPVPIQNEVNIWINSDNNGNATLSLTNYLGQIIHVEQIDLVVGVNKFVFNWNNISRGVHFVVIENDQERLVRKVF